MINAKILETVYAMVREQGFAQDYTKEVSGTYEVKLNQKGLVSLVMNNYAYDKGAAHGLTIRKSVTANLMNGTVYRLKDLFAPGSDYRSVLSDIIRNQIELKQVPLISPFKGIRGDEDFYLTEHELAVYYQLYEYKRHSWSTKSGPEADEIRHVLAE